MLSRMPEVLREDRENDTNPLPDVTLMVGILLTLWVVSGVVHACVYAGG